MPSAAGGRSGTGHHGLQPRTESHARPRFNYSLRNEKPSQSRAFHTAVGDLPAYKDAEANLVVVLLIIIVIIVVLIIIVVVIVVVIVVIFVIVVVIVVVIIVAVIEIVVI